MDVVLDTAMLDAWIPGVGEAALAAIQEANEEIADIARATVQVDTGATRDSITIEPTPDGGEVVAGGAALFLELGFHDRAGNFHIYPFLLPAYDAIMPSLPDRIAAKLAEIVP